MDVVGNLLSPGARESFSAANRVEQAAARKAFEAKSVEPLVPYGQARARGLVVDWSARAPEPPPFLGTRALDGVALAEIVPYIDWTPFFHAWELRGSYPRILEHPEWGKAARELFDSGRTLLQEILEGGALVARGVYGFFPVAADGDDLIVYEDDARAAERLRLHMLRQQRAKADGGPLLCLADFVAPRGSGVERLDRRLRRDRGNRDGRSGRPVRA